MIYSTHELMLAWPGLSICFNKQIWLATANFAGMQHFLRNWEKSLQKPVSVMTFFKVRHSLILAVCPVMQATYLTEMKGTKVLACFSISSENM